MAVSILHRISGDGFAVVGLGVLLWWLWAAASGDSTYAVFTALMTSPLGYVVLVGISWAFFNHLVSGLRHFVLDAGAGFELGLNKVFSIASPIIGILLTAAFWAKLALA